MALSRCPRCGGQVMPVDLACLQCGADYRPAGPGERSERDTKDMLYRSASRLRGWTYPKRILNERSG